MDDPRATDILYFWAVSDCGEYELNIAVASDAPLDETFTARCLDTGEILHLNGWLWTFEPLDQDALEYPDGNNRSGRAT